MAAVDGLSHLLKSAANFEQTITQAELAAANKVAYEVKLAWLGNMSAHGITPAQKIKRAKWKVTDKTWANQRGSVASIVYFTGAVHLIFSPTKPHIIGARHLGTRSSFSKRTKELGTLSAFGGGGRGTFGTLKTTTTRRGVVKDRMGARALHIAGVNWRPYAFHPGTSGDRSIWPESKAIAARIAPNGYGPARKQALVAAGFGQATGLGKAITK